MDKSTCQLNSNVQYPLNISCPKLAVRSERVVFYTPLLRKLHYKYQGSLIGNERCHILYNVVVWRHIYKRFRFAQLYYFMIAELVRARNFGSVSFALTGDQL